MKIGALVLAGGQSRRFGSDKRQATLPNGKLVIQQTLEKVLPVFDDVLVVLRKEDSELRQKLEQLFPLTNYYHAPDSELGMGHSLANGVSQIDGWDGVFVFLADMPFLEVETLERLMGEVSPLRAAPSGRDEGEADPGSSRPSEASGENSSRIIVPSYENKPGHPVFFGSAFFDELSAISGDTGARSVVKNHDDAIKVVGVEDSGVLRDVDEEADLG